MKNIEEKEKKLENVLKKLNSMSNKVEKMKSCGILIAESPAQIGQTLHDKLAR